MDIRYRKKSLSGIVAKGSSAREESRRLTNRHQRQNKASVDINGLVRVEPANNGGVYYNRCYLLVDDHSYDVLCVKVVHGVVSAPTAWVDGSISAAGWYLKRAWTPIDQRGVSYEQLIWNQFSSFNEAYLTEEQLVTRIMRGL